MRRRTKTPESTPPPSPSSLGGEGGGVICQKASRHEVAESSFIRGGGALRRFKHLQTLLPLLPDSAELRSADQHPVNQLSTNQEGGGRRRRRGYTSSRISLAEPHRTTCFPWPHRPWDGGRSFQKKKVGMEGGDVGGGGGVAGWLWISATQSARTCGTTCGLPNTTHHRTGALGMCGKTHAGWQLAS